MISYSNDQTIRFDHTPVINKIAFQANQVGPDDPYVFPVVDYDDTDDNTIYVNSTTGGDDSNPGTYASPKATLVAAINATTATKTKVVVQDTDTIFNEDISGATYTYLQGIYQETTGGTSSWVSRQLEFTPTNSNSIFVSKNGHDDSSADGTRENPYLSIDYAKDFCDASHQHVVIIDDGTYNEDIITFSGNFKYLHADVGKSPTICVDADGLFEIYDYISSTKTDEGDCSGTEAIRLSTGHILLYRYYQNTSTSYFWKLNESTLATVLTSSDLGNLGEAKCCELSDGRIMIVYGGTLGLKYKIYKADLTLDVSAVTLRADQSWSYGSPIKLTTGKYFIPYSYVSGSTYYYAYHVLNSDLSVYTYGTIATSPATIACCCLQLQTGDNDILYMYSVGTPPYAGNTYYVQLSCTTFSVTKSATDIGRYFNGMHLRDLLGGYIGLANGGGYFVVYDQQLAELMYVNDITSSSFGYMSFIPTIYRKLIFFGSIYSSGSYRSHYTGKSLKTYPIVISTDAVIDGINITPYASTHYLAALIYNNSSSALTIRYCNIYDCNQYDPQDEYCYVAISNGSTTINNSIIHDNDCGVSISNNIAVISDTQFYRHEYEYDLYIDGSGTGINIEHCDFFSSYGGIYLASNNGNETIKNCIIHDCSNYGLYADSALTITYSCMTSTASSTVTLGSYVTRGNPLYINEGYINPDDIDLNLRVKVLGYPTNSAAYMLADDSRNAGAYDVKYIGTETTYTSITVQKPNRIGIVYQYAGATNTQRKDGSFTSGKDGQSEVVTMSWVGMTISDYEEIIEMLKSDESTVLIYPDPETYPNSFEQWTLLRESTDIGVETPTLSDLGVQNLVIKFAKAL